MIDVQQLFKYYGRQRAVGPLSFTIDKGQIVGLLGLNGAGKTTALRILACDLLPSSGSVLVDGIDVVDNPHAVRKHIGYLPDLPPLYPEMTVHAYLVFVARLRGGVSSKIAAKQAEKAQRLTQIDHVASSPIASLSHGYRQRVGIAQAIVHQPKLILLDEPILGLDPVQIVEMRHLLRSLAGTFTIVLSSHNLQEISETCDRILVLKQGEIVASGTEQDLSNKWLRGYRLWCTVRGDAEIAQRIVRQIESVTSVTPLANAQLDAIDQHDSCVRAFEIHAEHDVRAAVVRALVSDNIDVIGMTKGSRELESVFIHLAAADTAGIADTAAAAHAASSLSQASEHGSTPPSEPPSVPPPPDSSADSAANTATDTHSDSQPEVTENAHG